MIYWRLLLLSLFVWLVCLLNMPRQIGQIEYALSHTRTRVLEQQQLDAQKALVVLEKQPYSPKYVQAIDDLGWIYFQLSNVTDAEATFLKEVNVCSDHQLPGYDPTYEKALLNISTYYRERADYEKAERFYVKVREYNIAHVRAPNPKRARDVANLGALYYLWAETIPDLVKRSEMLCRSASFCQTALAQYQLIPDSERAQGDVCATQALVLRDLGLPDKAAVASKRARQILASAENKAVVP